MPVQLAHFGEDIVHAMVCELGQRFLDLCHGFENEKPSKPIAVKEVPLDRYASLAFDGASRIDMLLLLEGNRGLPFEIKLGSTRLSRARINEEWLSSCSSSHHGTRWKGNMMSILERKFETAPAGEPLYALIRHDAAAEPQRVMLTAQWCIVARERVFESWKRQGARPSFSKNVQLISFESIVAKYEDGHAPKGQKFNALVGGLLDFDFYNRWIVGRHE
jgi:hypothetical protein